MIRGSRCHLRTLMENDLDDLAALRGGIAGQGDCLPVRLVSQRQLREAFTKSGFWAKDVKRLAMIDEGERIIGCERLSTFDDQT